jgi:hypothetical protein
MNYYEHYLSLRFNFRAFGTPPMPTIGNVEENLIFANLVMQGMLYSRDRLGVEMRKRTGREFSP